MIEKWGVILGVLIMLVCHSCSMKHDVEVAPVKVEPVHITIDVNIRVDRALDNFFEDIDKSEGSADKQSDNGK